ncbi:MAG: hypothetical protein ACI8UO_001644 [Verrucomicrobiales bacterium]|jgi:hypothetical protein
MNLDELIDGYLTESLDARQTEKLSQLLGASREARDEFRAKVRIHGALAEHFLGDGNAQFEPIRPRQRNGLKIWKLGWIAAAAAIALTFWISSRQPEFDPIIEPVAEIVSSDSAEWARPVSSTLKPGRQQLLAGMVELKIGNSVRIAIEGPAEFELVDATRMKLAHGKVAADVGEFGRGFTIETPEGNAIDLGTRFGVSVADDGASEVHVFEGEVDVVQQGEETLRLVDEEALRLTKHERLAADPWVFPMPSHELSVGFPRDNFGLQTILGGGFPRQAGWWNGDACKLVPHSQTGKVVPASGLMMLQFLATRSSDLPGLSGQRASELWHIVDLQPFAERVNAGEVTAKISSEFNRIPGAPNSEFQLQLNAFRGQIIEAENYWDRKHEPTSERLASSGSTVLTDENPETWERLEATMVVPSGTDFLLVNLLAFENETDRDENEFEGHFADNVSLSLAVKARKSEPIAFWRGEGDWGDSSNWEGGKIPDVARDRIVIEGEGQAVISKRISTKQSFWIGLGNDSVGRLRIGPEGELIRSGFGELLVGFNPGSRAELIIQGRLQTRSRAFIGRNNAASTVLIEGGEWDAGNDVIRMAQYGQRGPDTVSNLHVRSGGRLRAGALELVHDLATLIVEEGEVDLDQLRIGGEDGKAVVYLSGGNLRVDELAFGSSRGEFRFASPEAELSLLGEWTAEQLLAIPNSRWLAGDRVAAAADFLIQADGTRTSIRIRP